MATKRKPRKKRWSKKVEESGVRFRIFERDGSAVLWFGVTLDGQKRRESLKTEDRTLAEDRARDIAREIAGARLEGRDLRTLTLSQLFALYRRELLLPTSEHSEPVLQGARAQFAETRIKLFLAEWGGTFPVLDLSKAHVERFVASRRSGKLSPFVLAKGEEKPKLRKPRGAKDGTIDGDFRWLRSVFNFARTHKINGRPVLAENPLAGLTWPTEANEARPVSSHDRFVRTQEHTDTVDPTGRLRCILALARYTGRRESAICSLRAHDVLRDRKAIEAALAAAGMNEGFAEHWPDGAIRWPAETDKMGFADIAPLSKVARAEIDRYLRKSPRLGDVPLFPGSREARPRKGQKRPENAPHPHDLPIRRDVAARWLLKAEKLAELPKLNRGVFHPYRRLWATERKGLPAKDVAAAGGWRDLATLELAYQHADAKTTHGVVQHGT